MLTVGQLIEHLEMEREQLEKECRESSVSFLHYDFELEIVLNHSTQDYFLQITANSENPASIDANLKYLHCFNRQLPILTENEGFELGKQVQIVTHNSSCGKVEFCLTAA